METSAASREKAEQNWVFAFTEGDGKNKQLLGGKGANLCEMTQIGLNVPPGFVITTEACLHYLDSGSKSVPEDMFSQVREHMARVEKATGKGFGDPENPLLVSVRSGSAMSMPGMMDTILNLGLNAETLQGEIRQTGDARFGYDAYRRFIQLFGKVAMGVPDEVFDAEFEAVKQAAHVTTDVGLSADNLKEISERFLKVFQENTGRPFPEDPYDQLEIAIKAVFGSWMGKRAVDYRREFKITPEMANGTAVNVCTMVFGNRGNDSATGVAFTRNPGTGEDKLFGEYLVNAQGEDVVAGIRTPKPIHQLAVEMPEMARQLDELRDRLETHYKEVQDFEFTIERGMLYCLQTRNGKMNAIAMVRTSVEMVNAGLISKEQALAAHRPDASRADAVSASESRVQGRADGSGSARVARRGLRLCGVRRRPRRGPGQGPRAAGDSGARGDQAGGHPRLLCRSGYPDQPRRQDLARRGGRARHGQALRRRRRGNRGGRAASRGACWDAPDSRR